MPQHLALFRIAMHAHHVLDRACLKKRQGPVWDIQQLLPVPRHELAKLQGLPQPPLVPRVAVRCQQGIRVAADPMAQPQTLFAGSRGCSGPVDAVSAILCGLPCW